MRPRRTRIVATIGPATESPAMLRKLIRAGVDVIRLNFSHGVHDWHKTVFQRVRDIAADEGRHVAIMQDLQGPRIRTGTLPGGVPIELKHGATVTVSTRSVMGGPGLIGTAYKRLHKDVEPGQPILLADGTMELKAMSVDGPDIHCRVIKGGMLGERKGINLPGSRIGAPALTRKDRSDLALGLSLGVDMVALSFVRRAADIQTLRRAFGAGNAGPLVVAKIEHPEAITNIESILDETDAIMVARGDLGLEVPMPEVPLLQKRLIDAANSRAIPAITATQMLESMTEQPRPTRAEATDVANAIFDGTDAVMLSGETSIGNYPVQAVDTMSRIALAAEREIAAYDVQSAARRQPRPTSDIARAVCASAALAAHELTAAAIVVLTRSGKTASQMAWHREPSPILALTPSPEAARRLALTWGVEAEVLPEMPDTDSLAQLADDAIRRRLPPSTQAPIIAISGATVLPGSTNAMRVFRLREPKGAKKRR